jgi:hypothetical protein
MLTTTARTAGTAQAVASDAIDLHAEVLCAGKALQILRSNPDTRLAALWEGEHRYRQAVAAARAQQMLDAEHEAVAA